MDNVDTASPPAPASAPVPPVHSEGEMADLVAWIKQHGQTALIIFALLLAAGFAVYKYNERSVQQQDRASALLPQMRSAQDLEKFTTDYASTKPAALAYLLLAKNYYDAGDYDLASTKYQDFIRKFPKHPLFPSGLLGIAHCREAKQNLMEALQDFQTFQQQYPAHFLLSQAVFGEARCLEQLGRTQEARTIYENFIAAYPESDVLHRAEEALARLTSKTHAPSGIPAQPSSDAEPEK